MTFVLDGALGTVLEADGLALPAPAWTAWAVDRAPDRIQDIHRAYARAGATAHTAATFRTTPQAVGVDATRLTRRAVALARDAVDAHHAVWGSLAPIADCWRPQDSPPDAASRHVRQADRLAEAGVDGILVETFAHVDEAVAATRAAVATGLPVWASLTPGPDGALLSPAALADGARRVAETGATVVCANCLPADAAARWLDPLSRAVDRWGVYANGGLAGAPCAHTTPGGSTAYADLAMGWVDAGAAVIGGCCGTGPAHIRAIVERLRARG